MQTTFDRRRSRRRDYEHESNRWVRRPAEWLRHPTEDVFCWHIQGNEVLNVLKGDVYVLPNNADILPIVDEIPDDRFDSQFEVLADRWEAETRFSSSLQEIAMHDAYQHIIGLGPAAIPLVLTRMRKVPGPWFWALNAITNENPAQHEDTVSGATRAWLEWGARNGYTA